MISRIAFASIALLFLIVAGCERVPTPRRDKDIPIVVGPGKGPHTPFRAFIDTIAYSNNPRASDDWTRFREAFGQVEGHFSSADVSAAARLSEKERQFLSKEANLSEAELAEVDSATFRLGDAHYLDECQLLRDAAKSLEVRGIGPLDRARLSFEWVMRNVILHERNDSWTPPAFTLRRGAGSALERAFVYLALLRQHQLDGCLIAVPDTEPLQFLVGVHDGKTDDIWLFDPRLELPLASKDGVATLKQVQVDATLLKASLISPDQVNNLEARLVLPLFALAPRMRELEKGLGENSYSMALYLDGAGLHARLAKATTLQVKVWNAPDPGVKGTLPANSPTRMLRHFLPKAEGGVDETQRLPRYMQARIPIQNAIANYHQIPLNAQLFPGYQMLLGISLDLLNKYDVQTRELYLRGRYEAMKNRQKAIGVFARNEALAGLVDDPVFRKDRTEWLNKVRDEWSRMDPDDPLFKVKSQQYLQAMWSQDQFIGWLLQVEDQATLERDHKKTILTRFLAVGLREHFEQELARAQAGTEFEEASKLQSAQDAAPDQSGSRQRRLDEAWLEAKVAWGNFYADRIALEQMVQQRLDLLETRVQRDDIDQRIGLLEAIHFDVHKYFHARMQLAVVLRHSDSVKKSHESLARTKSEVEALEKKGLLKAAVADMVRLMPQMQDRQHQEVLQKRLQLLANDWTPDGHFFWLRQQIDRRLGSP
jgi:hypothetical protein